jgi:hypothetical protein
VVDVLQDHGPLVRGHAPGEAAAEGDPDILPDLFLQAARRGRDELAGGLVQQEDRGGVGLQDVLRAVQQFRQQMLSI